MDLLCGLDMFFVEIPEIAAVLSRYAGDMVQQLDRLDAVVLDRLLTVSRI